MIFLQYANHGLLFAANKFDSVLENFKSSIKSEEIAPSRFSRNEKYAQHRSQVSKWNFINTAPIVGCKKINQQEISYPYNKKTFQVKRWGSSSCFMISALIQVFAGCLISGHLPYALSNVLPANPYLFGAILAVSLIFVVIGICLYYLGQKQHQVLSERHHVVKSKDAYHLLPLNQTDINNSQQHTMERDSLIQIKIG